MPLDVIGQHAEKDVRPHVIFRVVIDRPHADLDPLQTAKRALDLREALILPHGIRRCQPIRGFTGADDIDPIELRFSLNGGFVSRPAETALSNRDREVLSHLVAIPHLADFDP